MSLPKAAAGLAADIGLALLLMISTPSLYVFTARRPQGKIRCGKKE
jgi:hypothetical protein